MPEQLRKQLLWWRRMLHPRQVVRLLPRFELWLLRTELRLPEQLWLRAKLWLRTELRLPEQLRLWQSLLLPKRLDQSPLRHVPWLRLWMRLQQLL